MNLREQVTEFHEAMRQPVLDRPQIPHDDRVRLRLRLIAEEFFELLDASLASTSATKLSIAKENVKEAIKGVLCVDLPELADALADIDYVVEGTRLEFGIDGAPIASEVHATNMAKLGSSVRSDGKIQKPEGWSPPDIARLLREQGWRSTSP